MNYKHAEIINAMNGGYAFVQEVHAGQPRAYFLYCAGHRINVSERVYHKMSEMDYIETNGRRDVDENTIWRLKRLTARYRKCHYEATLP